MRIPFAAKLNHLRDVRRKIESGKPVNITVFCSGNGDRSPLAEAAMREAFENAGYANVRVTSFGTSVKAKDQGQPASLATRNYAAKMGLNLNLHERRHMGDEDVKKEIAEADIIFAISPAHRLMAAEYSSDAPEAPAKSFLLRSWSLKGFANRSQWLEPLLLGRQSLLHRIPSRLRLPDPFFNFGKGRITEGEGDLNMTRIAAEKAAARLMGRKYAGER